MPADLYRVCPLDSAAGRRNALRRWRGRDRGLACRGGSRLRRAGTRHQRQDENGKGRTEYDCSFHNVNCFFNKRFFGLAG
jgi:hypothetical protein